MQYDVNNGLLQVVIEGEEINAVVGEAAQINAGEAINYIQSGKAEIEEAVEEGISDFNENATEKTNEFNLNAQNKTSNFNSNAAQKTLDFNSNASDKTSEFNLNAQDKTGDFNNNATDKTGDFNDNASGKTSDFNLNAQNKTSDFNDNYTEKKGLIDAQVVIAEGAATTATNQAGLAKQWAIGDPSEPVGNSSKYWAEYAESIAQSIGDPANKDLSNLSTTGNNRFVNLQQQIDAIVASSDVFDIVGTYAELQAYDISTVPVNDIVKVLVDSTHSGAATYYRCIESGGVKSWSYIGSEGAYYTKGEADSKFSTITATGNSLDYTGNTLSLENSSGTVLSSVTINSTPDLDNKSITLNGSSQLQTVGVIDSNNITNAIKTWTGTRSQYEALGTAYYAWYYSGDTVYTLSTTPSVGDHYYQYYGGEMHEASVQGNIGLVTYVGSGEISVDGENAYRYARTSSSDVTIGSNPIDANTLYNITDTGEIYLGSTIISNYGADTSLSNLSASGQAVLNTKQDVATAVNYNNISNCITYIPQDIKLELNNGTLTLKAGSKVYMPNGFEQDGTTPKFDAIVIPSDYVYNADFGMNHSSLLSFDPNGSGTGLITSSWYSGTTAPTSDQYMLWYDTNTNKIKWTSDYGTTWTEWYICLPIARITIGDTYNVITSIDQVFNGFGYIGSTVFALPGVKGLIPNGRNADGTLKNIEVTSTSVTTYTVSSASDNRNYSIAFNGGIYPFYQNLIYNEDENYNYSNGAISLFVNAGNIRYSSSKVTSFTSKTAFHAVDYNDSSTISGWSMPSSRYIDLTLGASGATYTAPANGYVAFSKMTTGQDQTISINCNNFRSFVWGHIASINIFTWMPVNKGDVFTVNYSAGGATNYFRFIYAEGEN